MLFFKVPELTLTPGGGFSGFLFSFSSFSWTSSDGVGKTSSAICNSASSLSDSSILATFAGFSGDKFAVFSGDNFAVFSGDFDFFRFSGEAGTVAAVVATPSSVVSGASVLIIKPRSSSDSIAFCVGMRFLFPGII